MSQGRTTDLWVSHSSIGDFLKCPRLYFLHNVYKDPRSRHRINIINPHLALGQAVHETIESISMLKAEERLNKSLIGIFDTVWKKFSGERGGFTSSSEEKEFKERGINMLQRVMDNPGPISNKAVKIKSSDSLPPRFYLSEENNIILCGIIDWIEYNSIDDSIHIIDFKTGKSQEDSNSLQIPIYYLLLKNLQKRKVGKASYWYLGSKDKPTEVTLPDLDESYEKVLNVALQIKQIRLRRNYECKRNGCFACKPYEKILEGKAKNVGSNSYQDIYIVNS